MTNEEMLKQCHEMEAELEVIKEHFKTYDVMIDDLQNRLDKVGEWIDKGRAWIAELKED